MKKIVISTPAQLAKVTMVCATITRCVYGNGTSESAIKAAELIFSTPALMQGIAIMTKVKK